jgi:hypothetical protein
VKGNTLADNTRSSRGQKFGKKFSGIGIALLGASGMHLTANQLFGNVPTGPTPISGGVVVSKDPYFGRNKPDIYWDESGSGNRFRANYCDTNVPSSLCK